MTKTSLLFFCFEYWTWSPFYPHLVWSKKQDPLLSTQQFPTFRLTVWAQNHQMMTYQAIIPYITEATQSETASEPYLTYWTKSGIEFRSSQQTRHDISSVSAKRKTDWWDWKVPIRGEKSSRPRMKTTDNTKDHRQKQGWWCRTKSWP